MASDKLIKFFDKAGLEEYLRFEDPYAHFVIDKEHPFSIHWANAEDMIFMAQKKADLDKNLINLKENFGKRIDELKNVGIWIEGHGPHVALSVYDIYATIIQCIKNAVDTEILYKKMPLSTVGSSGPFKLMSLIELVNETIHKEFILNNVIMSTLPLRKIRLNTKGQVALCYGQDFKEKVLLDFIQIGSNGLLYRMKSPVNAEVLKNIVDIKILMHTQLLEQFLSGEKSHFKENNEYYYTNNLEFSLDIKWEKVFVTHGQGQYPYLFVPYNAIADNHHKAIFQTMIETVFVTIKKMAG